MTAIAMHALSAAEVEGVHQTSLRILAEVGVDICHEQIRQRLLQAGGREGFTGNRVLLPPEMVAEALAKCPKEIVLSSVRGDEYRMAHGNRYFSSCVVDPFMVDQQDGVRPPKLADCAANARLIDALDMIAMPYKMDVNYDDASGRTALLQSNLAFMSNMSKHYICAPHAVEDARIWMEMCEVMAGASLAERPIVSPLLSPISPLTFDRPFLELVECLVGYGVMLILLPCPQSGATGPFTLAGTVVDLNVENLATIVIVQTLQSGTPLHYHHVAMGFDMKAGLSSLGGAEKALLAIAGVEMGRYYGLSCGCAGAATNSGCYDFQNGAETMAQLLLAVGSEANLITGIGSIGNGMGTSAEQILFDCDLIGLTTYLVQGIRADEDRLAFGALARVQPGGDFLQDASTLHYLRAGEHFYAGSFDKVGLPGPGRPMLNALRDRKREILAKHEPAVPPARIEDLRRYVERQAQTH